MSDELKPEERAAENAWLEFQRTNRRPSWGRVISEDSAFAMAKRAAEIALSRAAVKERGEDTKIVDWLSKQAWTNREGYREIHHEFKGDFRAACLTAMQQQPGGKS